MAGISLVGASSQIGFSRSSICRGAENGRVGEEAFAAVPTVPPVQLNVVLHGALAIFFDYTKTPGVLTILVPAVSGHVYGAGQWTNEFGLDAGQTYPLTNADPIKQM